MKKPVNVRLAHQDHVAPLLAAVDVGRQRHQALGGEAVADLLDLTVEPPPLLQDDHARTRAATPGVEDVWRRLPPEILDAHAATMEGLVQRVRARWGSFEGYATEIGVDATVPERLRGALLTDATTGG